MASFLAVVHARGFRAGARDRGLSQSAVSQHVGALENQLGVKLFARTRRGCVPTAAGQVFVAHAESLLRMNGRAIAAIRQQTAVIGASSNIGIYLLPPLVRSYLDANAGAQPVEIAIHSNPVIANRLDAGEIDVAAMEWWDDRPGYVARLWRREPLVIIVAPSHPWAQRPFVSRTMLRDAVMLGGEPGTGTGRLLARYFNEPGPPLRTHMRLESTEAVKHWVKAGVGVSIVLAGTVTEECRDGALCAIPLEGELLTKELFVIWRDSMATHSPSHAFAQRLLAASLS